MRKARSPTEGRPGLFLQQTEIANRQLQIENCKLANNPARQFAIFNLQLSIGNSAFSAIAAATLSIASPVHVAEQIQPYQPCLKRKLRIPRVHFPWEGDCR